MFVAGDIARSVEAPGRRVELHEPPHVKYKSIVKGTSYRRIRSTCSRSENTHLPKLVMFRTSNSSRLMSYLMRHFSRIAAVATTQVFYDLIESERPDVVIVGNAGALFRDAPSSLERNRLRHAARRSRQRVRGADGREAAAASGAGEVLTSP